MLPALSVVSRHARLRASLIALTTLLVSGCGGSSSATPDAPAVGNWVGSYMGTTSVRALRLDIRSSMCLITWLDGTGNGICDGYLQNGNTLTWISHNYPPFTCSSGSFTYGADHATGTISGNTMTVVYSSSPTAPCTAGGTVTLHPQ